MEVYFYSVSKIDDRGKGGSEKDLVESCSRNKNFK